ncbi:MAG: hypothetical protein RL563_209 [Pseudomonadota bacterium]|jgi:diguanylate cyclase (GGDEF)-like protein
MKILVVDDSKVIRQMVSECLKPLGHEVVYAENGQEAVDFVAAQNVDLVFMDVEMPCLDGLSATRAIRDLKKNDWFPIVFLTSLSDDESFVQGILSGGDAYLTKPINPVRLQVTVIAMERIYQMRQKLHKTQSELQRANKELEQLSFMDQLTGLSNRRHFDFYIEKQFVFSRRSHSPLSLIMCDVDAFKDYNDSYGHLQGDACLKEVAKFLKSQLRRTNDLACRYGGEEFALILPDTDLPAAATMAEAIREDIVQARLPHKASKQEGYLTLSLGVACHDGQYRFSSDLIKTADDALYKAKQQGRNRVVCG